MSEKNEAGAPTWQGRIEAACVTLACGGAGTGERTRLALMHPGQDIDPALCQKMAADVLFEVIMAACEVQPLLPAKVGQHLDELLSSVGGLDVRWQAESALPAIYQEVDGLVSKWKSGAASAHLYGQLPTSLDTLIRDLTILARAR